MEDSKSELFLKGPATDFSTDKKSVSKKRSLTLYGLLISFGFLLISGTPVWSFETPTEVPSMNGELIDGTKPGYFQVNIADSLFTPFEIAQLTPGRVQVLESEPEDVKESRLQFTENTLKQAGFILPETSPAGVIIKNIGNHNSFGTGEIVYLDIGLKDGATKGSLFTIFSKVRPILHPVIKGELRENIPDYERPLAEPHPTYFSRIGKRMGYLVHPLGYLEIIEATAGSSKAIIKESYNSIQNGDFVTPFEKLDAPPRLPEAKGEERLEGYVIAFKREHSMGGLNGIVYIDRGRNDKVIPGDRFEIYVTPTMKNENGNMTHENVSEPDLKGLPLIPHVIAELQVLDTQEETSTGIVISGFHPFPLGATIRYKPVDIVSPPLADVLALQDAPIYAPAENEIPLEQFQELPPVNEPFADLEHAFIEEEEVEDAKLLAFSSTGELMDIRFQFDQYDLDESSRKTLLTNIGYLQNHPNMQIQIEGYCDERGTNNYNLALGERRARAVKNFMVSQGIQEERFNLISYGEEKPFCNESQESCWSQNRRVHFLTSGSDLPVN